MSLALDTQCLIILHAAASTTVGLVLRTSNPTKARQTIYRVRKEFADPSFADLMLRASPDDPENELWVMHKPAVGIDLGLL